MVKEYGYEYNATADKELLSRVGWRATNKKFWGACCLRSGRDALKVIAREHPNTLVFLPSLCCDSMITPFEMYGCNIIFYSLTNNLTVDYLALLNSLQEVKAKVLLLFYDYFGIRMFESDQLLELKKQFRDLILIKDVTHNLLNVKESELYIDYTIASLRKWVNIPDGGLLWTKRKLNNPILHEDQEFAKQRLNAQCMRTEYFATGDERIKSTYRQIFSGVSSLLENNWVPVKMTEYSYELAVSTDWAEIKEKRRENANVLINILAQRQNIEIINRGINNSDLYVPIIIEDRDKIQHMLSSKGIFNTIIWPLRKEQIIACSTAEYLAKHMLAVPCDQRYTKADMSYVGTEIVRVINE